MLASTAAAGLARTLTNARLHKWGDTHISDEAFLVASEMINNAINETPGKEIKYRLSREGGEVLLAVWDSSHRVPTPRAPTAYTLDDLDLAPERWDDNGGWGLGIIEMLASSCGYTTDPSGGKWVWACLKP
ncbi:ATP-binding protein [Actinomadura sp. NBRC 104412]|uniref:ATP-binding protein n=1 Tax=Actinomadura sp. NBRC 104412 TaxID=3032203 RepID=UPI002552F801|nr:ATP-binding protein [Actinomadura sp. NBRC 104412]